MLGSVVAFLLLAGAKNVQSALVDSLKQVDVSVTLPEISYLDLLVLDKSASLSAAEALISTGAIQITNIPGFSKAKIDALNGLPACLRDDESVKINKLIDKSSQKVIEAVSMSGIAGPMSNKCGDSASSLRALVDSASHQLFASLDTLISSVEEDYLMLPSYKNFVELSNKGEHIEHLHAYYPPPTADISRDIQPTMELHTDSGLFIAMTTGNWNNHNQPSLSTVGGVYIQSRVTNTLARMVAQDDALIFMIGEGGANWLAPLLGYPLHAASHLLVADVQQEGRTRAWYGKMFLPPRDGVVGSVQGNDVSFAELKQTQDASVSEDAVVDEHMLATLPLGCGNRYTYPNKRAYLTSTESSYEAKHSFAVQASTTSCDVNQVLCWMKCMPMSDYNLTCPMSEVQCVDTTTNQEVPGDITCPSGSMNCALKCGYYPADNSTSFCVGIGQSMDMSGFISTAGAHNPPCFNLLFTTFTLNSETKFAAACIGVFLLGVTIQLLTQYRAIIAKTKLAGANTKWVLVLLYGIQVTLSYFIMLAAMTYSSEIFAMVVCGLTVGYGVVNVDATPFFNVANINAAAAGHKRPAGINNEGEDGEENFGDCCANKEQLLTEQLLE